MLWLCGPAVKTQPSHGCYWGSIPHRVTNTCLPPFSGGKFYISEGILTPDVCSHVRIRDWVHAIVCGADTLTAISERRIPTESPEKMRFTARLFFVFAIFFCGFVAACRR